jgi:DNA-binding CsgD family transcriptional regulator
MFARLEDAIPTPVTRMFVRIAHGCMALARGDHARAVEAFATAGEAAKAGGSENRVSRWRLGAALAASALGRGQEAVALADEQVTVDRVWGAPGGRGEALRVRAVVGDPAEARDRLAEAVRILHGSSRRLELGRALVDWGIAMRRAGNRIESRTLLREGLDIAAQCGARTLAERARAELVVAGARPRRDRITGRDALTPTEQRIAQLASEGYTNRVIAQMLFVTPKTVEVRLTSVYRKLEIPGRELLAAALTAPAPENIPPKTVGGPPYSAGG